MIPANDPRTSATPQVARHARSVQTLDRPGEADATEMDRVAQLSEMVAYLRSLQEHYGADRRLNDRIRDIAVRLQALVRALSETTSVEPARGPLPLEAKPTTEVALSDLEAAFMRWLTDPVGADEVRLDGQDRPPSPMRQVLEALRCSVRPLPGEVAATLGLPAGTPIGQAVSELREAVDDPRGPRCRSHRAAVFYLRGLDRTALAAGEAERGPR